MPQHLHTPSIIGEVGIAQTHKQHHLQIPHIQSQLITNGGTFDGFYISGSNGSTVSGSVIVIPKTGTYDFQFSLQLYNTSGGGASSAVNIWLVVNGSAVPYSNTQVSVNANSPYVVAAWDFMGSYNSGDKLELMWSTTHINNTITALSSSSPAPETPSVIFTIMEL